MAEEKRIWNLRLNLDDFNSEYLKLRNDSDRFQFFLGFHLGCMGGDLSESDLRQFADGHRIGFGMFRHAEGLSKTNSENASKSVDARKGKYGTAQPMPSDRSSDRSSECRTTTERTPEPNELTINPTNEPKKKEKPRFVPPTEAEATEYANQIGFTEIKKWMGYYEANGWKAGKTKMVDWRGAMRYWLPKDGAAGAAPTPPSIQEWMQEGQAVATSNTTRNGAAWPRDLCSAAYYQCASSSWRGITDWRGKLRAECLRWVGNENGRAR